MGLAPLFFATRSAGGLWTRGFLRSVCKGSQILEADGDGGVGVLFLLRANGELDKGRTRNVLFRLSLYFLLYRALGHCFVCVYLVVVRFSIVLLVGFRSGPLR